MSDYMRGVAVDCGNRPPSYRKLANAEMNAIRIEMRDLPEFYTYTQSVNRGGLEQTWLVGPSTGPIQNILDRTVVRPSLVIIGNEPDVGGGSSWTMTPSEYIHLWTTTANLIHRQWPQMELATAGMYSPGYLFGIYPYLQPKPGYVNRHYPDGLDDIKRFDEIGGKTIIGEWCWRNATQHEMYDWEVNLLEYSTWASFWFCWADYMVPGMGLVRSDGSFTKAYRYLKRVLERSYRG